MKKTNISILPFFLVVLYSTILSQEIDSLKNYNLKEITVSSGLILEPKMITNIDNKEIEKSDASSLSELGKFIPSVKLQTNSRGESLFYLRGSGERQVSLFFDGVPLNIPWDNRIDLSLIPTGAIGKLSETKGIPSTVYGANTIAGVINVDPLEARYDGHSGKISLQAGENNLKNLSGLWIDRVKNLTYSVTMGFKETDGYDLPDSYNNIKNPGSLRINSDNKSFSIFSKGKYDYSTFGNVSLSVSFIDAEKGVTPETDVTKPRYWKYPEWNKLGITLNGENRFEKYKNSTLAYTLAYTKFNMQIDQYDDITYSDIDEIQKDDDRILYGRVIYSRTFSTHSIVKLSASGYNTVHKENLSEKNNDGALVEQPETQYEQNVYSFGAEYEYFRNGFIFVIGGGLDGTSTQKAGEHVAPGSTNDYSFNTSLVYAFSNEFSSQLHFGRKTRFPTMREAYSGALGRFVVNPDLKAESATNSELSFKYKNNVSESDINFFAIFMKDGIVRESRSDGKFMRVNKDKIRTLGIELLHRYQLNSKLSVNFNLTYMNSYAENTKGDYVDTLEYKPQFIGGLNLNYDIIEKLNVVLDFNYIGKEYGLQQGNEAFQELPDYFLTNIRLSYLFDMYADAKLEAYFRINNLFDRLYYTQWSLPEAGRQIFVGVVYNF